MTIDTIESRQETLGFQTEVKQLLHLVIHSLYSNREIFLRELISNASDAADKLRFAALSDPQLYENDSDLNIHINLDKKARTITIKDNGIGMSREEVIDNLGTIAKSGTREFLRSLTGDQAKDTKLIGQFGVGFYSAFIVADKVVLLTRRAGMSAEHGVRWESEGTGEYTISNIEKTQRGTEVILHLKEDADEFLEYFRLKHIINTYSDHISLPILMPKQSFDEKTSEEKLSTTEFETVNRATALWTLPKKDITDNDYIELYKHISHDFEAPLQWIHNRVEGKQEYISLLYIPTRAPFDLWEKERKHGIKLYVNRVFIMDDAEQFMPNYLRFVKGIIDSSDLPLNISREILQHNKTVETIRAGCVTRVLDALEKMATDDTEKYLKFWQAFGKVLKEGPAEDMSNRNRIAKLLRFSTTHNDSQTQTVSFDEYISRMKPEQEKIYYITAETFLAAQHSPHLEIFRKKGIEVLLLAERVDEWLVAHLTEYEGKSLQSVARGDLDLGKMEDEATKEQQEKVEKDFNSVITQAKEVLGDKVKEVRVTHRLTDSPACVVDDENGMSSHMQRLLKAAGQTFSMGSKPIFELNPMHPIVSGLKEEADDDRFAEWINILFEQAVLSEGGHLDDPASFVQRLNKMLVLLSNNA